MKKYIKPSTTTVKIVTNHIMNASDFYNEPSAAEQLSRENMFDDFESEITTFDDFE
jgi:hypothetical protein